jgi:protein-tyrosine-phosphatase
MTPFDIATSAEPLRVLVVCTANRCRSPVAEVLLWKQLALADVPAVVTSAGFLEAGQPIDPTMASVMAELGIDLSTHRSRQVSAELLADADLVLTMERSHAREVAVLHGGPLAVATFQRFAATGRPAEHAELVGDRQPDEIPDPIGRPASTHRAVALELERLAAAVAGHLVAPR